MERQTEREGDGEGEGETKMVSKAGDVNMGTPWEPVVGTAGGRRG